jgi:hypothetical protein
MVAFFNSHLSTVDVIFRIIALSGIISAIWWNVKAAKGVPIVAQSKWAVAGLASIYFVLYMVLLFSNISQASWASITGGIAIIQWQVVWVSPAKATLKGATQIGQAFETEVNSRLKAIGDEFIARSEERMASTTSEGDEQ